MVGCAVVLSLGTGCSGGGTSDVEPDAIDGGAVVDSGSASSGNVHDPLSRPEQPTLDVWDFEGADSCRGCHPDHFAQWSQSMHAYAVHDPVFRALVAVRQADFDGEQDQFCMQCHTAIGTRGGEIVDGFAFADLSPVVRQGVTCEACHRVADVARTYNSGHVIEPDGPIRGPLEDPVETRAHESEFSALFDEPEFCAGCHDVIELTGLNLERPYEEYLESPGFDEGATCQDCHMPSWSGQAATRGAERDGLHDHRFLGVDVPLDPGFRDDPDERAAMLADVRALVATAAAMRIQVRDSVRRGERIDVVVTVDNQISSHGLPTGTTFIRQCWIELTATDASGAVLYRTGHLDDAGDLRDHWSTLDPYGDPDLVTLSSRLVNALGEPELFPWRAAEHTSSAIPAGLSRSWTFFVPTAAADGAVVIAARLRLRTHPPFLLRVLGLEDLVPYIETFDLATAEATVAVAE